MRVMERGLGVLTAMWGLVLLWPGSTFATSLAFHHLSDAVSEDVLGAFMLVLGLCKIVASLRWDVRIRGFLAAVGAFVWLVIALSILSSVAPNTGWVVYSFVAWLSAHEFYELWAVYEKERRDTS